MFWWFIAFVLYLIASVIAFFVTWSYRGKRAKDKWYDYFWAPGAMFVALVLGQIGRLIEYIKLWRAGQGR